MIHTVLDNTSLENVKEFFKSFIHQYGYEVFKYSDNFVLYATLLNYYYYFYYDYLPRIASSVSTELLSMRVLPSCETPTGSLMELVAISNFHHRIPRGGIELGTFHLWDERFNH